MALTKDGYTIKRLAELKKEYDRLLINRFGPINTQPDSVIGQLEGIWAEALANIYEQAQDTYHAMYPFSAEGVSLDGAVSYVGITRFAASATQVIAAVYGKESTLLKSGAQATNGGQRYQSMFDAVISRANAVDTSIEMNVRDKTQYSININGTLFNTISVEGEDATQIMQKIADQLNPNVLSYEIKDKVLRIFAVDGITPFALSVGEHLKLVRIGSPARFIAMQEGRHVLPLGALTEIVTPRSGWDAVCNLAEGVVGRERESDAQLRVRFEQSRQSTGSATVKAIRARLIQEVAGVSEVHIFENRTGSISEEGMPPHAFEALVVGGDNQSVANALWRHKPAGIETYGAHAVLVKDENGDGQQINFSRPTQKLAWIKINVTGLYNEENLPQNVISNIKKAVLKYGSTLKIGDDIILQRMLGPIYSNTSGLAEITIEAAMTEGPDDEPVYQLENVAIDKRSVALFDESRLEVIGL
ncbi:baseplate J/gp47 family protein [Pragia fontium]|uniref:baseplate J/gp47 family protein n=1 Tax=Pragia fontium TaxID=82985 RepID=UPI000F6D65E3|nr:baseplate J/gp47 family protein [Pragia fontium]VEJ54292.1 Uncharacterized homolog of phage Mu protein gp47 [Pragia fontium]